MEGDVLVGLTEVSKKEAQVVLEAGYLYLEMGKPEQAEEVFQGAIALLPRSDVPRMALGQVYFSQGRSEEAVAQYEEAVKLKPDSAAARAFLGEALLFSGNSDAALNALDKAIELDEEEGSAALMAKHLKEVHEQGVLSS